MADPEFERSLERLFAEPPPFPDADTFSGRVEARLGRGWAIRRWLIGAAGVAGGVVAAHQLLFSGVVGQIGSAGGAARGMHQRVEAAVAAHGALIPSGGDGVVWTAIAVAVVLAGFVVTRVIEEI